MCSFRISVLRRRRRREYGSSVHRFYYFWLRFPRAGELYEYKVVPTHSVVDDNNLTALPPVVIFTSVFTIICNENTRL